MLVLSRKIGEEIIINNNIKVTVIGIERGKVRLGVVTPDGTPVHRKEVLERPGFKERDPFLPAAPDLKGGVG